MSLVGKSVACLEPASGPLALRSIIDFLSFFGLSKEFIFVSVPMKAKIRYLRIIVSADVVQAKS
jgi:hypothetical protein